MKLKKWLIVVAAPIAAAGIGVGVATAVWTVTGSGTGSGAATVAQSLTITASTPTGTAATLYPGGPAGAVYFEVTNPNPFAVTITGLSWGSPVSLNTTTCPSANVVLDASAPTSVSISIPANATPGTVFSVPGVLDMLHTAPNGCQGVGFDIAVTVTGAQQ